jgi:hypothetical protein
MCVLETGDRLFGSLQRLRQYGIRFESNQAAENFVLELARTVEERMNEIKMLGRSITLKIMKRDPSAPVEPPKVFPDFFRLPSIDGSLLPLF